ncbi:prepilin-type N-terminal cleavage/methylation domain-containing protein [Jeotgalibacillus haloalkalitolerans]|uniref:Prepilin-type N-terminal cleavage/methylation domain-containing protein n=1 Tax=Jeotgalibacillus haloalkalitolerans TaxID=3104292 RepID=A0ABU5KNQ4_9BACL|nr:prepilin-type N-terminal cleavage/methylation domain-containing protein [Jeotgalibacillus sp. HH7-29]MDZ5712366.1 prepilin-type N-terminal cleavage/methylation domain-containing protein [Jeotgalibacillus sp. HH7-29]
MKKIKNLLNQKGLTLVELLAVLVIIAIIAAIAVPIVNSIINDSDERAEAAEALNIISSAKLAELSDNTIDCESSCDQDDLSDYIQGSDEFTVTRDATTDVWSIAGHGVNGITEITADPVTEDAIETYLDTTN